MKKIFLALSLMFGILLCPFFAAEGVSAAEEKTVTISVEKFTLGQGYYMEPITVPFTDGETAADVTLRVLGTENCRYDAGPFYLRHIYDPDAGTPNFPKYIRNAVMLAMDETDISAADAELASGRNDADWLGEFDYFTNSGWMIIVNNEFISTSAGVHYLKDGDVVRWQYTIVGLGADLGDDTWSNSYVDAANKDALTEKMAEILKDKDAYINGDETKQRYFDNAMFILTTMTATQEQVDMALANLNGTSTAEPTMPDPDFVKSMDDDPVSVESISLHRTEHEMEVGETFQLLAFIAPLDADNQNVTWISSNPELATVDKNGLVTAVKSGTAKITVTTEDGGKTASCMITVNSDKPVVIRPGADTMKDMTDKSAWYFDEVDWAMKEGFFNGDTNGNFNPNNNITRAEFAQMLYNYYKDDASVMKNGNAPKFNDVKSADWFYEAVVACAKAGIFLGDTNGNFNPNAQITRQDASLVLMRIFIGTDAINATDVDVRLAELKAQGKVFPDFYETASYARKAMAAAAGFIFNGDQKGELNPTSNITRAETATVLYNYFN